MRVENVVDSLGLTTALRMPSHFHDESQYCLTHPLIILSRTIIILPSSPRSLGSSSRATSWVTPSSSPSNHSSLWVSHLLAFLLVIQIHNKIFSYSFLKASYLGCLHRLECLPLNSQHGLSSPFLVFLRFVTASIASSHCHCPKVDVTREPEEVSQLPPTWHFAFEKSPFPCFSL